MVAMRCAMTRSVRRVNRLGFRIHELQGFVYNLNTQTHMVSMRCAMTSSVRRGRLPLPATAARSVRWMVASVARSTLAVACAIHWPFNLSGCKKLGCIL